MTRKKLITVAALAVVALACSESVGGMMQDAGDMLADAGDVIRDAGDAMQPDAEAQDTPASCNKSEQHPDLETKWLWHWAEFPISDPGRTEATICYPPNPDTVGPQRTKTVCSRSKVAWYEGTTTGYISCGVEQDGATYRAPSIIVHN